MGLSIRKYATLRGVTEGAVRKAISSGRITPNEDGTIDVERADREWKENTDEAKINTGLPVMTENMPAANGKPSFTKIKTAHELYKAQLTQLALQEKKGGNVCINRFIGIDTGNLFDGLKRIAKDTQANPNEDLIIHAYKLGYIYENEYQFLMQIKRKRKFSDKQMAWKEKINRRIVNQTVVRKSK